MSKPKKFSELAKTSPDFELPLLGDLMGYELLINEVQFKEGDLGAYAIVTSDKGVHRTSSKVLLGQLELMVETLEKGIPVSCTLAEKKSGDGRMYYTFE